MMNTTRNARRSIGLSVMVGALLAVLALTFSSSARVDAQSGPTATPTDRLWLAFSAARGAVEEKFNVDLAIIQRWSYEELEFLGGIDDCVSEVAESRPLYFGWRFVITAFGGARYEGRSSFDGTIVVACDEVTTTAPATAVAGAVNPNLPAPVAGSGATGTFELGGHVVELNANTVNLMRRSGMVWVKKQLRYSLGQDPSVAAGLIQSARSNGFKILLGIVGDVSQMGDFNSYIGSYAAFVGGVAALGADAIEVWNEPNIDREWPAGTINGGNYTQLLAASFNAIKSRSAGTIVVSGAPAPTGFFGAAGCTAQGCNDDVFMQQMAAAGAGQYLDCVGLHYNEGIIAPSQTSGDPRGSYPSYYFQSMLGRGLAPFGGKPACWTELGYLTPQGYSQPLPGNFAWGQNTTVAQQAAWLADAAVRSAQSGRVRLMIVWNVDFTLYTADDPQGGYAMARPDGSCPSCDTLGTVMRR